MEGSFLFDYTDVINSIFEIIIELNANNKKVYKNEIYSEQTLIELMCFLEKNGFPIDCFDLYCPVSKYFASSAEAMTPDLTIINPKTMQPLAFFRTYNNENDFLTDKLFNEAKRLNRCSNILLSYPYYIVIKQSGALQFYNLRSIFCQTLSNTLDPKLVLHEPIRFVVLQNNDYYRNIHNKIIDKNKLQRFGKIAFSVIVPLLAIILLMLDKFGTYELTNLRLIVLGTAIISILIPYLTQISIKDFSIIFKGQDESKNK